MNIADAVPVIVALSILIGGAWSVMSFVRNHVDSLRTEMRDEMVQIRGEIARLIEIRNTLLETIRQTVETRTAEIARQLAGLGERVTAMRFDQIKEIGPFVPRPEIESRFQRLEGLVASQNEKLDDILRHVSGIPPRRANP